VSRFPESVMPNPPTSFEAWFREHRASLSGGGLYLDGNETGRMPADHFERAALRLLLARPSTYDDVRPSITHRLLYWAARQVPGVYVDIAFLPPARDLAILRRDRVPLWLASGCKRSPRDFDIVGVSLSVQQEACNLPGLMVESGLEPGASRRASDERHPLLLLGGHAAASTPFLHGDVDEPGSGGLFDAVCNGDGVSWLQEVLRLAMEIEASGGGRSEFLRELARRIPGSYVPSHHSHIHDERGLLTPSVVAGSSEPVGFRSDSHDVWLDGYDGGWIPFAQEDEEETIPLAAGCVYRCRFCQSGWLRGGHEVAGAERLVSAAIRLKAHTAASDLNLLASDACSVKGLCELVGQLEGWFERLSLKSLAVPMLAKHRELRELVRRMEKTEFTFGVEGISARLRSYLGKAVSAEDLCEVLRDVASGGLRQAKLFFIMTGLEDESDLEEYETLLRAVRKQVGRTRVITSFTPLFHAPFTPLQFDEIRPFRDVMAMQVESVSRHTGCEFRWSCEPVEIRLMNLLCRAGRRATRALVDVCRDGSSFYYHGLSEVLCRALEQRLAADGLDPVLLCRAVKKDERLPWDDLASATRRDLLWRSYRQAHRQLEEGDELPAGKPVTRSARSEPVSRSKGEVVLHRFICHVDRGAVWHPDITVARGLLREMMLRSPEVNRAYAGRAGLHRFPGSWGCVLLEAAFRGVVPEGRWAYRAVPTETELEHLLFLLQVPAGVDPERILKAGRIPFQSVRRSDSLWSVVGKSHRRRTGVMLAERGAGGVSRVLCSRAAAETLACVDAECLGLYVESRDALECVGEEKDRGWRIPEGLLVLA